MTAASAARKIQQYDGTDWMTLGVKANQVIYHGTMVGRNTTGIQGVPASTTIAPIGVADLQAYDSDREYGQATSFAQTNGQYVTGTGSDGGIFITVRQGVFKMLNKAGDLVTTAHLGSDVYVEDDQTVRATASGSVVAGKLICFDDRDGLPMVAIGFSNISGSI